MKRTHLHSRRSQFLASLAAGGAAAGLLLCGNLAQAQPGISAIQVNGVNDSSQIQFEGAVSPNPNTLSFFVSSQTANTLTTVTVTLNSTNLPGGASQSPSAAPPGGGLPGRACGWVL